MQFISRKYSLMPGRKWDKASTVPAFRRNYSAEPHGEIFKAHVGGDKFQVDSGHNYTAVYAETLAQYDSRGQPCRLLELGIFRGESLAVWAEFLSANNVIGAPSLAARADLLILSAPTKVSVAPAVSPCPTVAAPALPRRALLG